jgi:hypothetical protein
MSRGYTRDVDRPSSKEASGPKGPRTTLGRRLHRGLGLPAGIKLELTDPSSAAPVVVSAGAQASTWYLRAQLVDADEAARPAMIRGVGLGDAADDAWDRAVISSPARPIPGVPIPMPGLTIAADAVLPPFYFCKEKRVIVPAADGAVDDPRAALWRATRPGAAPQADPADLPCLTCDEKDRCYPAAGPSKDPGTAGGRLVALSEKPWSGSIVQPFHVPLAAWLRLASGEAWRDVRKALASWPPSVLAELDEKLGGRGATVLRPDHGTLFALETFLLRLDWLQQLLGAVRGLQARYRRPHLGLGPETIAMSLGTDGVLGSPLSTCRLVLLATGAVRAVGDGSFEPLTGRSAAMVPPDCQGGGAWVRGRCHPRATAKTIAAKIWQFNFVPTESATQFPGKGAVVRFAIDDDGKPAGAPVEGRVDLAYREVWAITVSDPTQWESSLREMLRRDSNPAIVIQPVSDHGLADDLYAIGTLWLSTLAPDPGDVAGAVRLRQALRGKPAGPPGPTFYDRILPPDLLESALDLGNRMCGGIGGAFPGQGHEPVSPAKRVEVYDGFLAEAAQLAGDARHRLFGYAPADAEIRAVLEGALRAS